VPVSKRCLLGSEGI